MNNDTTYAFETSFDIINNYFKKQNNTDLIFIAFLFTWLLGGIFENVYLFLISIYGSIIIFLYNMSNLIAKNQSLSELGGIASHRFIVAIIAHSLYINGNTPGESILTLFDIEINVILNSQIAIIFFLIFWAMLRFDSQINNIDRNPDKIILNYIRGILRTSILLGLLYSIFSKSFIPYPYDKILFVSYIIEPIVYYQFNKVTPTISFVDLYMGNSKLPIIALRDSMLSNLLFIIFTHVFKGINGGEWDLLIAVYIIAFVIILIYSFSSVSKFNQNPLAKTILGEFIENDVKEKFKNIDLMNQNAIILPDSFNIELDGGKQLHINNKSIIIPTSHIKDKYSAIVIGSGKYILDTDKIHEQLLEGVNAILIPKKSMDTIIKKFTPINLSKINFEELGFPSIEELQKMINKLGSVIDEWSYNIVNRLQKIDLSNYGISEINGVTKVNLPGISVYDAKNITRVNLIDFLKVIETPSITTVRIGNFLRVLEVPNFTFVNLPGITVIDLNERGSAINFLGFKIGEGVNADEVLKFTDVILENLDSFESQLDRKIGRMLADKETNAIFNLSWKGNFYPLLENKKIAIPTDKNTIEPYLVSFIPDEIKSENQKLLEKAIIKNEKNIIELTGINKRKNTYHHVIKLSSNQFDKNNNQIDKEKLIREKRREIKQKIRELKNQLGEMDTDNINQIISELDKLKDDLKAIDAELNKSSEDIESTKMDVKEIYDADYEIVDD